MSDISLIKSKRGRNLVQYQNFLFRVERKRENLSYWKCSSNSKCKAGIVLYKDIFKSSSGFHTHEMAIKEIIIIIIFFFLKLKERTITEMTKDAENTYIHKI